MKSVILKKVSSMGIAALFVLASAVVAAAGISADIARDFSSTSGVILQPVDSQLYLTDIGSGQGGMIGDLLSLEQPGERLLHPSTGVPLQAPGKVMAVLRITRVKADYSIATPLRGKENIAPGAHVKRFSGLTALFLDRIGSGRNLYAAIASALPDLDWQGYFFQPEETLPSDYPQAELVFILSNKILQVFSSDQKVLRAYPVTTADFEAQAILPRQSPGTPAARPDQTPAAQSSATPAISWGNSNTDPVNELAGYQLLAGIDENLLMADFCRISGGLLLATTDGRRIRIYRLHDGTEPVTDYKPAESVRIHSLRWWQPMGTSDPYLVVTATSSPWANFSSTQHLESKGFVLKLAADRLIPVADQLDYLLGSFDRDGDGQREVLLGQRLDLDNFFGNTLTLSLHDDRVEVGRTAIIGPPGFPVPAGMTADLTGEGRLETAYVSKGILTISRGGEVLYQFGKDLGGSRSQLNYDRNPGQVDALFSTVAFEVPPVVADVDADGQPELLAVASDHSSVFSLGGTPEIGRSRLVVVKYHQGNFRIGSLGGELNMAIQGIGVDNGKVFIAAVDLNASRPVSGLYYISLSAEH